MTDVNSIKIADLLLICATVAGPILAVQAQKIVERATEKTRRRTQVFYTLMATRGARVSSDHVQALNMLDILFNGVKIPIFGRYQPPKEKKVIDEWREYHDILNEKIDQTSEAELTNWNSRKDAKFIDLLYTLAAALGFDFDKVLLKRGVYTPRAHSDAENAQLTIRDCLVRIFSGHQPIPMAVTHFPGSQEAFELQTKVQNALLKYLSNDKPLKVSIEEKSAATKPHKK